MSKAPMVTRTVEGTSATVLCLNTTTAEPFNETVLLSGKYKDNAAILKAAKKLLENEEIAVARVVDVAIIEKRYGMTEQEFIAHAVELPPLPKKQVDPVNQ